MTAGIIEGVKVKADIYAGTINQTAGSDPVFGDITTYAPATAANKPVVGQFVWLLPRSAGKQFYCANASTATTAQKAAPPVGIIITKPKLNDTKDGYVADVRLFGILMEANIISLAAATAYAVPSATLATTGNLELPAFAVSATATTWRVVDTKDSTIILKLDDMSYTAPTDTQNNNEED